jgi:hypothetical protein
MAARSLLDSAYKIAAQFLGASTFKLPIAYPKLTVSGNGNTNLPSDAVGRYLYISAAQQAEQTYTIKLPVPADSTVVGQMMGVCCGGVFAETGKVLLVKANSIDGLLEIGLGNQNLNIALAQYIYWNGSEWEVMNPGLTGE